LLDKVEKLWYS